MRIMFYLVDKTEDFSLGHSLSTLRLFQRGKGGARLYRVSLVAQLVKNLTAMKETWVQSLDQEDPLEKGMATHPSILAWRIPRTEEPGGLQSVGL